MVSLLCMLTHAKETKAQKRLDSIVKYAYAGVGNDSIAIAKKMYDYNNKGQLISERKLTTDDYIRWRDDLRTNYIYDANGRVIQASEDSFLVVSSTWKQYAYRTRNYSSDSSYAVQFFERVGTSFEAVPKKTRVFLFADGKLKSRVKLKDYNGNGLWQLLKKDSMLKNYSKNFVSTYFESWNSNSGIEYYRGPKHLFFYLDSSTHVYSNKSLGRYARMDNSPLKTIVYRNQYKALSQSRFVTSDSIIYFLNSKNLPDSSHQYKVYWTNPSATKLQEKILYTWRGYNIESIVKMEKRSSESFEITGKTEFGSSTGMYAQDTVFYKTNGFNLDKYKKISNDYDSKGYKLSRTEYRWSSLVDSFDLHEKETYFYSEPPTALHEYASSELVAYPNPSTGVITLIGNLQEEITLYDLQGNKLKSLSSSINGTAHIEEKGVYLIRQPSTGQVVRLIIH